MPGEIVNFCGICYAVLFGALIHGKRPPKIRFYDMLII